MAIPIPSPLIEFVLLGPLDDRRQLQDSPILGDVWVAFGQEPDKRLDLLIVPYRTAHPGQVAGVIEDAFLGPDDQNTSTSKGPLPTWEELIASEAARKKMEADKIEKEEESDEDRRVAYLQGLVVARLTFAEVLTIVGPKTRWWLDNRSALEDEPEKEAKSQSEGEVPAESKPTDRIQTKHLRPFNITAATHLISRMMKMVRAWNDKKPPADETFIPFERFLVLMGLIEWASTAKKPEDFKTLRTEQQIDNILNEATPEKVGNVLVNLTKEMLADKTSDPLVWQVSLNRRALPALSRSVPAVKADAAKTLFNVNCSNIGWAVIDSGIHGSHPAFMNEGVSRVQQSFDFKNFRRVVSLSNDRPVELKKNLSLLLNQDGLLLTLPIKEAAKQIEAAEAELTKATEEKERAAQLETEAIKARDEAQPSDPEKEAAVTKASANSKAAADREAKARARLDQTKANAEKKQKEIIERAADALSKLATDARDKAPIHWELVEMFVAIDPGTKPQTNHGTHVAGIIGASKDCAKKAAESGNRRAADYFADGMCPDILLYDFRVLGPTIKETEFAIIAALQFIRHLNERDALFTIHGANLSLSIPHDVRNFACGRTPICDECERLIASGVVVVAAAGNHGYKSFQTAEGSYDSYAAFSITDPGNAENVVTVGATHRFWPHTYGVSFFSSRGPTGDGRLKPDLVAPGEKIHSTFPDNEWGDLDGTSMAAPHVSGAAAMLLARYSELIGQPMRVKRILCESATDLGRERSFQGRGMLDVLRSFQSI